MQRLFEYLRSYRLSLWQSVSWSIIHKLFDLMPPFLTAWMIDTVAGSTPGWINTITPFSDPWTIIIFLTILTVIIFGFESFTEWLYKRGFMRLAQKVQHDLRVESYEKLQRRELAYFEEQRTGNLMAMLNDDINQLERFLNNSFNEIVQMITLVIFAGWSLIHVSWELGLIGMAPIPFIIWGSIYYQRKIAPYYKDVREGVGALSNQLENNISGILVIKSFTAENYETERIRAVSAAYRNANFKAIRWSSVYVPLIRILITIGFATTLLIGAYWVLYVPGKFSIGSLAFFAMMIQRLLWPVTRLGLISDEYERARASSQRIFGLLDSQPAITNTSSPFPLSRKIGEIVFEKVGFQYQAEQPILKQLDLRIPSGKTVGIAGPTGGGKTTIVKLLLRLYEVNSGSIKLEGLDIRSIDLYALRQRIALVSQDVYLFHGSIKNNIAYGKANTPINCIMDAAKRAELHNFITSLPNGYETIVGERGIKLSGGQRQRLSIARAILKDAPIIILDEATSAVDTETEKAIQKNLSQLTKNRTAIIIAHRLSTIRNADQIYVLKNGSVEEHGTHFDLLNKNGVYADLWNIQIGVAGY